MRKTVGRFILVALVVVASRLNATAATCTVKQLDVAGTFPFSNVGAVGLQIPVDIDAATGKFTLHREAFTTPYPSPGLKFQTGFGPFGWLDWDPGPIDGTIDSNGQVVIPNFATRFWTDFSEAGVAGLAGGGTTNLMSGIQARVAATRPWLFLGSPVAADGTVKLEGTVFVNFQLPLQTGTGMTCQLSPAPVLTDLPKGPKLNAVKGKVKPGTDPAAADDEIALTAVFAVGATAPVLDGSQDVLVRLRAGSGLPVNLYAPGGSFQKKGKKLVLQDATGGVIQAISDQPPGQDQPKAPAPTKGGSVTVTPNGRKRATIVIKLKGLETSQLTGAVEATVAIGTQSATRTVNFVAGHKATKFH